MFSSSQTWRRRVPSAKAACGNDPQTSARDLGADTGAAIAKATLHLNKTRRALIGLKFEDLPAHFVGVDDAEVGWIATAHLLDVGCRTVAHIGGSDVSTAAGRTRRYREVLVPRGVRERADFVVMRGHTDDAGDRSGYDAMRHLLSLKPQHPDGVSATTIPPPWAP